MRRYLDCKSLKANKSDTPDLKANKLDSLLDNASSQCRKQITRIIIYFLQIKSTNIIAL